VTDIFTHLLGLRAQLRSRSDDSCLLQPSAVRNYANLLSPKSNDNFSQTSACLVLQGTAKDGDGSLDLLKMQKLFFSRI